MYQRFNEFCLNEDGEIKDCFDLAALHEHENSEDDTKTSSFMAGMEMTHLFHLLFL